MTSGFIGLILGVVFATIIDVLTPDYIKSVVSLSSVIIAVSVSILIGLLLDGYQLAQHLRKSS